MRENLRATGRVRFAAKAGAVSDGVAVAECAVGPSFGSDHLPLAATLRLPR